MTNKNEGGVSSKIHHTSLSAFSEKCIVYENKVCNGVDMWGDVQVCALNILIVNNVDFSFIYPLVIIRNAQIKKLLKAHPLKI